MIEKIGELSLEIINTLNLDISAGTAFYIGESNRRHMKNRHPLDYEKYYNRLSKIISDPDYAGINPSDGSIEIIKKFGKYVKIAVRIANDGEYYARSLYAISSKRIKNFLENGMLFPVDKKKNL